MESELLRISTWTDSWIYGPRKSANATTIIPSTFRCKGPRLNNHRNSIYLGFVQDLPRGRKYPLSSNRFRNFLTALGLNCRGKIFCCQKINIMGCGRQPSPKPLLFSLHREMFQIKIASTERNSFSTHPRYVFMHQLWKKPQMLVASSLHSLGKQRSQTLFRAGSEFHTCDLSLLLLLVQHYQRK